MDHDKATFELTATTTFDPNLNIVEGVNFKSDSTLDDLTAGGQATNDLNLNGWGGSTSDTIDAAVAGLRYISFTIQSQSGFELNLNGASVNFTAWRNGGGAPEDFGLAARTDGGTFVAGNQIGSVLLKPHGGSSGISNPQTLSFTFSGAQWDGVTDAVEIRLYGWDGTGNLHTEDTTITGASVTVVPELSSAALLGLGGLALILRRRK